ncbi:hypothetical protein CVT26_010542 [Gymnopilus dilepis]|uniref:DinB-like domain-containing protein n=1 Tax=Gymnopilus dilepis TaxID=231916 RepID=A0A409VZB7_9AGAR|nr:hypothetical protein CVT26_010542 [Gymnopilus dilepis]
MVHTATETSTSMPATEVPPQQTPHSSEEVVKQQISVATTVLLQAVDVLDNHLTSDEQLTIQSKHLPGSTIGKHLRHARDHFELLLACMQSQPPRVLSYDTRIRNTPMETSIEGARTALLDSVKRLEETVPTISFDEEITLQAITPYMHTFKSTLGREVRLTITSHIYWLRRIAVVRKFTLRTSLVNGEYQARSFPAWNLIDLPFSCVSSPANWFV